MGIDTDVLIIDFETYLEDQNASKMDYSFQISKRHENEENPLFRSKNDQISLQKSDNQNVWIQRITQTIPVRLAMRCLLDSVCDTMIVSIGMWYHGKFTSCNLFSGFV